MSLDFEKEAADIEANVIFGAVIDESLGEHMRVTVIATGFDRQRHAEAESDKSVERPPARIAEVLPPKTNAFEVNDEVLEIPRFLRDKD